MAFHVGPALECHSDVTFHVRISLECHSDVEFHVGCGPGPRFTYFQTQIHIVPDLRPLNCDCDFLNLDIF